MAYFVTILTFDGTRSCVMQSALLTKGMRSIISMVSISLEGFLPSILLLVVTVVIVTVILVVVIVAIVGVVVVVGDSAIIKLSFGIIGFLRRIMFYYLLHQPLGLKGGRILGCLCVLLEKKQQGDDVASWWPWNVFESAHPTKGMRSIISTISISLEGFLPFILLLVVTVVIVTVILVVVTVVIVRVVVVVGDSAIIKISFVIIGFLCRIVFYYLLHQPLGYGNGFLQSLSPGDHVGLFHPNRLGMCIPSGQGVID
ncbi:hypothetical protein Tco_0536853 [Tanacetum coccineum]